MFREAHGVGALQVIGNHKVNLPIHCDGVCHDQPICRPHDCTVSSYLELAVAFPEVRPIDLIFHNALGPPTIATPKYSIVS